MPFTKIPMATVTDIFRMVEFSVRLHHVPSGDTLHCDAIYLHHAEPIQLYVVNIFKVPKNESSSFKVDSFEAMHTEFIPLGDITENDVHFVYIGVMKAGLYFCYSIAKW